MEWTNNYLKRCFRSLKEAAVIARLCTYQVPQKRSAILLTCRKKQNGVPVLAFKRYSKDTTQGEPMLWIWWCLEETALWKFAKEHFLRSLLQKNSGPGPERPMFFLWILIRLQLEVETWTMPTIPGVFIPHQTWRWIFLGGKQRENVGTLWENTLTMCTTTYLLYMAYVGGNGGEYLRKNCWGPQGSPRLPFEGR